MFGIILTVIDGLQKAGGILRVSVFMNGLVLELVAKLCPNQPQAFKKVTNSQSAVVSVARFTFFFFDSQQTGSRYCYGGYNGGP